MTVYVLECFSTVEGVYTTLQAAVDAAGANWVWNITSVEVDATPKECPDCGLKAALAF